jgi:hypothetical protein
MIATLILTISFFLAPAALADDLAADGTDQALMGLNGIITSPADVVLGALEGDNRLDLPELISSGATEFVVDRVVGTFTGGFTTVYRLVTGIVDIPLAVFPVTNVSPDPLFVIIPGAPAITAKPEGFPGSPDTI